MFGLSFWEIGLVMLVALVVLGPKRLPELAKTLGKGLRELRRASTDLRSAIEQPLEEVRRPLQDMRDDLVDTVYRIEEEVQREADDQEAPDAGDAADPESRALDDSVAAGQLPAGADDGRDAEEEARRQRVEEIYAAAAREDAVDDEPGWDGEAETPADEPVAATDGHADAGGGDDDDDDGDDDKSGERRS